MKFNVLVYENAEGFRARTDPARHQAYWASYAAYAQALEKAGVAAGGAALQGPETATTLRIKGGKRQVQDGPISETKEQLGGYFTIEVPDLDAALEWAAKCPAATEAGVEVRPLLPMNNR